MRDRIYCTASKPWDHRPVPPLVVVIHESAVEVGEQKDGWPGGDIIRLKCPHCGHTWTAELPQ
jgi:hypothetical protein